MRLLRWCAILFTLIGCMLIAWPPAVSGEGSGALYGPGAGSAFRANIEWMARDYNRHLLRRTLLRAFVRKGEYLLVASSAVGVSGTPNLGDIWVYNPGLVTGPIGREAISPNPSFSCVSQRGAAGNGGRGRIASRSQELAGPNASGGYLPCFYRAPATGIYHIAFLGPSGPSGNDESSTSGRVEALSTDFGPGQRTSVTAWEVAVAASPDAQHFERGRVFTYYIAGSTGGENRPTDLRLYLVTNRGFIYRVALAVDPGHFVAYANQVGFLNSDGQPLYHNVLADPTLPPAAQDQLERLQGGTALAPPEHPLFFDLPASEALAALGVPRQAQLRTYTAPAFVAPTGGIVTEVGLGGVFEFTVDGRSEDVYRVVISQDGTDFAPRAPRNRVLYGFAPALPGKVRVAWDGRDNEGQPFPQGNYVAQLVYQQGEVHIPLLDVENNLGQVVLELINPPDVNGDGVGDCLPYAGGCFSIFFDNSGYRTANGAVVGIEPLSLVEPFSPLCPNNAGNPPATIGSDPIFGTDSRTSITQWGFASGGDGAAVCDPAGGFGDKKGIDFWAYYQPPQVFEAPLRVIAPLFIPRAFLPLLRR